MPDTLPYRSAAFNTSGLKPPLALLGQRFRSIFSLDYRSLALFRICLALVLLADLAIRAQDLTFFYTDAGALSRAEAINFGSPSAVSLYFMNGSWVFQLLMFCLTAGIYTALLWGWRTETAAVLTWILLLSLHRRNPQVLQGGDNLLRCLTFWAMFVPLGRVWSLDSRNRPPPDRDEEFSAGTACLILQVAVLYYFANLLKTGDAWRVSRTAVFYALNVDQLVKPLGQQLLHYPELLKYLTVFTLGLETYGPFLVLIPFLRPVFRLCAIFLFVGFHFGLLLTMELGPFPFVCFAAWTIFIPQELWRWICGPPAPGAAAGDMEPVVPSSGMFGRLKTGALLGYFGLVLLWNIRSLDWVKYKAIYPAEYNFILELVGLDQNWGMFAPYPMNWDGWYVIAGITKSGRTVNLSPGRAVDEPVTDVRPERIAAQYPNERWRKYMIFLATNENYLWRGPFTRAILNRWAAVNPDDPLRSVEINFWLKRTTDDGPAAPEKYLLWRYDDPAELALPAQTSGTKIEKGLR